MPYNPIHDAYQFVSFHHTLFCVCFPCVLRRRRRRINKKKKILARQQTWTKKCWMQSKDYILYVINIIQSNTKRKHEGIEYRRRTRRWWRKKLQENPKTQMMKMKIYYENILWKYTIYSAAHDDESISFVHAFTLSSLHCFFYHSGYFISFNSRGCVTFRYISMMTFTSSLSPTHRLCVTHSSAIIIVSSFALEFFMLTPLHSVLWIEHCCRMHMHTHLSYYSFSLRL